MADSPPVDNRTTPIPDEETALSESALADTTSAVTTEMPADSSETSCSRPVPTNPTLVSANTTEMCEGDGLPDRVCQHCLQQMKASLEFVAKVRSSDLTLKECMHKMQPGHAAVKDEADVSSRSSILSHLLQRPCSRKNVKQAGGLLCARRSMSLHSYAQHNNNNNNNNNNNAGGDVMCRYLNAKCGKEDKVKPTRDVNDEADKACGLRLNPLDKQCGLRLNPLHKQAPVALDKLETELDLLLNKANVDHAYGSNRWRVECDSMALALCKLQREARHKTIQRKTIQRKTVDKIHPGSESLLRDIHASKMADKVFPGTESLLRDIHASKNGLTRSLLSARNLPRMQRDITVCFNNVATKVEAKTENETESEVSVTQESEVSVTQESEVNVGSENVVIVALIDASNQPTVQEEACNGEEEEEDVEVKVEMEEDEIITGDYEASDVPEDTSHVTTNDKGFNSGEIFYFDVQEEVIISDDVVCEEVITEEAELEPDTVLPSTSSAILDCEVLPADVGDYIFACEMCSKSFKRKKALMSHVKMHTLIKSYGPTTESKRDDSRPVFKCDICFKCYISKAGLKIHRSKAHTDGNAACPECQQVFDSKAELAGHLKTFKHKELRCNRCLKTFVKRQAFVAHTHIHPQFIYKCATCMKTFAEEAELKEHASTHKVHDAATGNTVKTEAQVEQFQRMKFDYCLSYVGLVKTMFATQPDRYMAFLDTIKDFKFKKLNVDSLLVRISQLFKDHRELIAGFNTFMPHGFKIELPPEDSKLGVSSLSGMSPAVPEDPTQPQGPDMDLDYSLSYLSQIKSMFATQPKIYNDFTFIIKEYKLKTMEIPEVIRRVSHLFRDYPELIAGFNSFLPPWCKINVSGNAKKEKEDIDPLASGSCSSTANGNAESSKARYGDNGTAATTNQNSAKRAKRRNSAHYNSVSKKVKMEVISNDNLFKTINQANNVSEHMDEDMIESEDIVEVPTVPTRPKSIVETITSLCHQLQTMVDKDLPSQSQAGENITYAHEGEESTQEDDDIPAEIHSFVCHVCLKSFNKKQLLTDHVKQHQFKS